MRRQKKFNREVREVEPLITVTLAECHNNPEKMVRRFIKKVKNDGILEEFRNRTHYKKPSVIKSEKKRNKRRLIEKELKKQKELLNISKGRYSKRRRKV